MFNFNLLKEMSHLNAVSGDETDVREYIKNKLLQTDVKIETDNIGNLHIFKKGKKTPNKKLMLAAHMDEVGFIVNYIDKNGYIFIKSVGSVLDSVCIGRKIRFKSGIIGVIGNHPVHLLTDEQKNNQPKLLDLVVDIGANSREEALPFINLGDLAYFVSDYFEFGDNRIKGKALDDRIGCAILLDILINYNEYDLCCVFTAAEEIGTRGAAVASYIEKPEFAIVLEATTANDITADDENQVCILNCGTVVSYMDLGTVYDKELYNLAFETAKENDLKCQTKTKIAGGNDSAAIHKAIGGIRTLALSAPCRYIHSPSVVADKNDILEMRILCEKMIEKLANL